MISGAQSITEMYAEAQRFFRRQGKLHSALAELVVDLDERQIDYLVIGGIALTAHGYARFTQDVDLILTPEGFDRFTRELVGLSYVPAFSGSSRQFTSIRDNSSIKLYVAGEYPGDGQPKPVTYPSPRQDFVEIEGVRYSSIETLIELKLAAGMTTPHSLKNLADVQELIKVNSLSPHFAERLDPYVRKKYLELLDGVQRGNNFRSNYDHTR